MREARSGPGTSVASGPPSSSQRGSLVGVASDGPFGSGSLLQVWCFRFSVDRPAGFLDGRCDFRVDPGCGAPFVDSGHCEPSRARSGGEESSRSHTSRHTQGGLAASPGRLGGQRGRCAGLTMAVSPRSGRVAADGWGHCEDLRRQPCHCDVSNPPTRRSSTRAGSRTLSSECQ